MIVSIVINLGILAFFKYFNFFQNSLVRLLNLMGFDMIGSYFNIILPVGISFYTFQTMSYTIDVYKQRIKPENNFLNYCLYVSFFPQLIAGPIERGSRLLPQIRHPRQISFEMFSSGVQLMLVGYAKKIVIADGVSSFVNQVFRGQELTPFCILMGCYAFALQIYGDFSGYTDIARGCARVMGFELCSNFRRPYLSVNPKEFWSRWHISLSEWLRDYLYVPLGGNRGTIFRQCRNLMITMLLGGFWHGAAFTFILWGMFHGVVLIIYHVLSHSVSSANGVRSGIIKGLETILFFHVICFGWLIFRAESVTQIKLFISTLFTKPWVMIITPQIKYVISIGLILFAIQLYQERRKIDEFWKDFSPPLKVSFNLILIYALILLGNSQTNEFIYFQF
nr:MBOAT family O-acyltransferase [uncultured Desulfobacter sp.]